MFTKEFFDFLRKESYSFFETFSNMQAGQECVVLLLIHFRSEDAFTRTHERQNLLEIFPGSMVTLLYWSVHTS